MEQRIARFFISDVSEDEFEEQMERVRTLGEQISKEVQDAKAADLAKADQAARLLALQSMRCPGCGNTDSSLMTEDRKEGTIVCNVCGLVVQDHFMDQGAEKRTFENEEDKNHHGPAKPIHERVLQRTHATAVVRPSTGGARPGDCSRWS